MRGCQPFTVRPDLLHFHPRVYPFPSQGHAALALLSNLTRLHAPSSRPAPAALCGRTQPPLFIAHTPAPTISFPEHSCSGPHCPSIPRIQPSCSQFFLVSLFRIFLRPDTNQTHHLFHAHFAPTQNPSAFASLLLREPALAAPRPLSVACQSSYVRLACRTVAAGLAPALSPLLQDFPTPFAAHVSAKYPYTPSHFVALRSAHSSLLVTRVPAV